MRVEYHPDVEQDLAEALRFYDPISQHLGNDFLAEFRRLVRMARMNPSRFHLIKPGLHRANLSRFPYHFLYRELPDGIRITLVRHNRRHPSFGMGRQ